MHFLVHKSMVNIEILLLAKIALLGPGKNPHAQYVFSHWHRISPSKDIEKKFQNTKQSSIKIENMILINHFTKYFDYLIEICLKY